MTQQFSMSGGFFYYKHFSIKDVNKIMEKIILKVPVDGVSYRDDGRFEIVLDGKNQCVAYYSDVHCWFTIEHEDKQPLIVSPVWKNSKGEWVLGDMASFANRPQENTDNYISFELPAIPNISKKLYPVPNCIHYIWIGQGEIPEHLSERIKINAQRCPSFNHILHVHIFPACGIQLLEKQFKNNLNIKINDMTFEPWFKSFLTDDLGGFYKYFLSGKGKNLAAAADIVRLLILQKNGGIYMDVDNVLLKDIDMSTKLFAGKNDLLLNRMLPLKRIAGFEYDGYSNDVFACCRDSNILKLIISELKQRLSKNRSFFDEPRPFLQEGMDLDDVEKLRVYIWSILKLTGPALISDVLQKRCDYFNIEKDMLDAFSVLNINAKEPRIIAEKYLSEMLKAKKHYLPFGENDFHVLSGSARTWF